MYDIFISSIFIITGFGILILGGEALVRAAISLAARAQVPPAAIALTIVAFGTSAPELITSMVAAFKGSPDIAVGNVVGSNIFNLLAIIGVASIIRTNVVKRQSTKIEWPFLVLATGAFILLAQDLIISMYEGIFFLVVLTFFLIHIVRISKKEKVNLEELNKDRLSSKGYDILFLVGGIALLLGGAHIALQGAVDIGRYVGLTERVIGLTIVSVGTGLPELATSIIAARKGRTDIAVANVIGSNIMNTLAILGATAAVFPIRVNPRILNFDAIFMLAATTIMLVVTILAKGKINRNMGIVFIAAYALYLYLLI